MAKRARAVEAEQEPVKPSDVRQMPSGGAYKKMFSAIRSAKKDVAEIAGGIGAERKSFIEKYGYNRDALNLLGKLSGKEPEKIRDFWDCFQHGFEVSGLQALAESVNPMDFGEGEDDDNIEQFPGRESVAAE